MKFSKFINSSWRQTMGIIVLYCFFVTINNLKPFWDFGYWINLIIGLISLVITFLIGQIIIWFFYGKHLEEEK